MNRRLLWGGLVLFFVLFSLAPTLYELARKNDLRPDRAFELVHNYYTDYNLYLSRIRQGREGAFTVTEKYTSEPHAGSFVQILYLGMGKAGALVGVPAERTDAIYHTARIVLSVTLLLLISYAAKWAFETYGSKWPVFGFLLAVTGASWPILVLHKGEWRLGGYMPWWSLMDSLQRMTFLPHMLIGQSLILFILMSLTQSGVMKRAGNWIFLGVLAALCGTVFPAGLTFIAAVWGVFVFIDFLFSVPMKPREKQSWIIERILGPTTVGMISAPTTIYFFLVVTVYPWKRLVDFAIAHPLPFDLREYLLAVGPMLWIGALGALWVLWKREKKLFIFVAWVITWFFCIIVFQHIKQESPLRFTEMIPQVPLGFLAGYLFYNLYNNYKNYIRYIWIGFPITLIALGLAQMYSSWRWQKEFIDQKIIAGQPLVAANNYIMYPLKDFIAAMKYLEKTTPRSAVILSETTAGNYIPVVSGNTVYVGHSNTVNSEQKEPRVKQFFAGGMSAQQAKEFLETNNLHYIFFGPQEIEDGNISDLTKTYSFITQVYKNPYVRIYRW